MNSAILALLFLASAARADLPSWYQLNHRTLAQPVFQKSFFKSTPPTSTSQGFYFHTLICVDHGGLCSGALVDDDKVLTSAQCVNGASHFEIHLNAFDIYNENSLGRIVVNATIYIQADNFSVNVGGAFNDLAIIFLDSPVVGIVPVSLPNLSDDWPLDENLLVHAIGYGQADPSEVLDGKSIQPFLQASSMSTLPFQQCNGISGGNLKLWMHLCAFAPAVGSCYGDPGSPLIHEAAPGVNKTLIAVASFGSGAPCETGAPIIFTNLRYYLPWLESNGVPVQKHSK